jgi:hypothetical protein
MKAFKLAAVQRLDIGAPGAKVEWPFEINLSMLHPFQS